jgi:hypothetical protein
MKKYYWKSFKANMKSVSGNINWELDKWFTTKGKIKACENGFHASDRLVDAFQYISPEVIAKVEVKGDFKQENDKVCYQKMRIVKAYIWTQMDSIALSIYCASLSLKVFEKLYPNDSRPRNAIDAATVVLSNPTDENKSAARSAESAAESAAWSAARSAARSAAWSAESAAWSAESAARSAESAAWSAARSAAWSAESAAWSAESAAWSAAWSAAYEKAKQKRLDQIEKWIQKRIKSLQLYHAKD